MMDTGPAAFGTGALAVFVPGLLSSSRFFSANDSPDADLVLCFRRWGFEVLPWEPPGIDSLVPDVTAPADVDFKSRVEDLITAIRRRSPSGHRLILVGHSLGGTQIYGALALLQRRRQADLLDRVRAVITIASPARLDRQRPAPWAQLFTARAHEILAGLDRDGWLSLPDFLLAQGRIATRRRDRWIFPGLLPDRHAAALISHVLQRASRFNAWSRAILSGPELPSTFLRNRGDFTPPQLRRFLASRVLQRDSTRLVTELLHWGRSGGTILIDEDGERVDVRREYAALRIPTLTLSSRTDQLVSEAEVTAMDGPTIHHQSVGSCGHGAYLFKTAGTTLGAITAFLSTAFERTPPAGASPSEPPGFPA